MSPRVYRILIVCAGLLALIACTRYTFRGLMIQNSIRIERTEASSIKEEKEKIELDKETDQMREFFKDIFSVSNYQKRIDKSVVIKTLKFMLEEVDEYDPKLVDFVRSLIIRLDHKYPKDTIADISQHGQSTIIDKMLNSKRDGFFIEAGAHNGEFLSNSLFFEVNRNWTGIMIEPTPDYFASLVKTKRSVYVLNACIAKKTPLVAKFRIYSGITGRESEMDDLHRKRISDESRNDNSKKEQTAFIPCFSLNTIMRAINVNTVDYFSLDIEGGEYDVVKSIDYAKLLIRTFTIEYSANYATKDGIIDHLRKNSYNLTRDDGQDIYMAKVPLF